MAPAELLAALDRAEHVLTTSDWPPDVFAALFDILAVDGIWQTLQDQFIVAENNPLHLTDAEERVRHEVRATASDWAISPAFRTAALATITQARQWHTAYPDTQPSGSEYAQMMA